MLGEKMLGKKIMMKRLLLSAAFVLLPMNLAHAKPTGAINSALSNGETVLVWDAIESMFPAQDVEEHVRLPGAYRPHITYWKNRLNGEIFIAGTHDATEGKGKALTKRHFFQIASPGIYDLVGFAYNTRFGDLENLKVSNEKIQSNIGFVNYSETVLPQLYVYDVWVPPSYTGSTFNGNTITEWYDPGYWDKRKGYKKTNGIFVDVRKLVGTSGDGKATIASFLAEPGKMVVVPDFAIDFTTSACNTPVKGQFLCPITSLTLSLAIDPQLKVLRQEMANAKYDSKFLDTPIYGNLMPGTFFNIKKIAPANNYTTETYKKYVQFRVTELTMPKTPVKAK